MNSETYEGYLARDKDGTLKLYSKKPHKSLIDDIWVSYEDEGSKLDSEIFQDVNWEDNEPIPTDIEIRYIKNNENKRRTN